MNRGVKGLSDARLSMSGDARLFTSSLHQQQCGLQEDASFTGTVALGNDFLKASIKFVIACPTCMWTKSVFNFKVYV